VYCSSRHVCIAITHVGASHSPATLLVATKLANTPLISTPPFMPQNAHPSRFSCSKLFFPENKRRNTCMYLRKNLAMTISVEQKENESTTKGSDSYPRVRKHHQISLTLNTRRGKLPKHSGQSSRYTYGSSGSATIVSRLIDGILMYSVFEIILTKTATALF